MKTQIIQLETHDDIISVQDKMTWGQTRRVLLVWPEQEDRILNRELDLVLLKRHSTRSGAQLALVTSNPDVCFHASRLGIPVFDDIEKAQSSRWRQRRRNNRKRQILRAKPPINPLQETRPDIYTLRERAHPPIPAWMLHPATRIVSLTLGVLAVLAIAVVLFPSAEVTLIPEKKIQEITFTAMTGPTIQTVNPSGAIPTHSVNVIVEGRTSSPTTGSVELPDTVAKGRVEFTNLTEQAVVIPVETVLRTTGNNPIRFTTTRQGLVSAGVGQTIEIPIEAIQPGSAGNVPENTILSIEGPLGVRLTVNNPLPTSGGDEISLSAPTQLDRRHAFRSLLDALRETAMTELLESIGPNDLLLTDTPFLKETLEETYIPEELEPTDEIEVKLRLEFQALIIRHEDLQNLAEQVLNARLEEGFSPLEDSLIVELATEPDLDMESSASWQLHAERIVQANLVPAKAVDLILGAQPQTARAQLADSLPIAGPPSINIWPDWWPRLPFLPFRVEVQVAESVSDL